MTERSAQDAGLGVGDLDVIQCHDGANSKGLAGAIKNTIILTVLPMAVNANANPASQVII